MPTIHGIITQCPVLPPERKFSNTSKTLLESRNWTFSSVRFFTWKVELVSNILSMLVSGNSFLSLTPPRSLQTWYFSNVGKSILVDHSFNLKLEQQSCKTVLKLSLHDNYFFDFSLRSKTGFKDFWVWFRTFF